MKVKDFFKVAKSGVYLVSLPGLWDRQVVKNTLDKSGSHRNVSKEIDDIKYREIAEEGIAPIIFTYEEKEYAAIKIILELTVEEKSEVAKKTDDKKQV